MTGIEPAYSAWEADVLPLNYIGTVPLTSTNANHSRPLKPSVSRRCHIDSVNASGLMMVLPVGQRW
jgi:hypothetical protein